MAYLKPQSPLQHTKNGDYFYPLTTIDQVITEDGRRLSSSKLLTIDNGEFVEGEAVPFNADMLGGIPAEEYLKKNDAVVLQKNYSITGRLTEPENPTENMIWVETDTVIGKVYFSEAEPRRCAEGDLWIRTGNNSNVSFDSLQIGDTFMNTISPLHAKQYVSDAWVDKTAKSYQGGVWVAWWDGELFWNGDQYEKITGGWSGSASINASGSMTFSGNANGLCTELPISRGDATELHFNVTKYSGSGSAQLSVCFTKVKNSGGSGDVLAGGGYKATGEHILDISGVSEPAYLYLYTYQSSTAEVDKIWMK